MLPYYANLHHEDTETYIWKFVDILDRGDADGFMKELRSFFANITYELKIDNENNFQNTLYIFMALLGLKVKAEAKTSDGRIDLQIESFDFVYIIELKYGGSAQEAITQIERKQYALKYENDSRTIIYIGANFDPTTRRINDWQVYNA